MEEINDYRKYRSVPRRCPFGRDQPAVGNIEARHEGVRCGRDASTLVNYGMIKILPFPRGQRCTLEALLPTRLGAAPGSTQLDETRPVWCTLLGVAFGTATMMAYCKCCVHANYYLDISSKLGRFQIRGHRLTRGQISFFFAPMIVRPHAFNLYTVQQGVGSSRFSVRTTTFITIRRLLWKPGDSRNKKLSVPSTVKITLKGTAKQRSDGTGG